MLFDGSCLMLYKCEFGNLAFFFSAYEENSGVAIGIKGSSTELSNLGITKHCSGDGDNSYC